MRNTNVTQRRKLRKERDNTMKRLGKKIMALGLAGAMVFGMSIASFAADSPDQNVLNGNVTATIPKDIVIYNTAGSVVYEPNITYTYRVDSGPAGKTVIDKDENSAVTKAGSEGGLLIKGNGDEATAGTTATLIFGRTETNAANTESNLENVAVTAEGVKKVTKQLTVSFDITKFTVPGIYRYKLTESSEGYGISGVTKGDASDVRYLDVYVKWKADGTGLEVYGLTMFTKDEDITYKEDATGFKLTGYDVDSDEATKTEANNVGVDTYHTYNVTVRKNVDGLLGDKTHEFPFAITLNEATATAAEFYTTSTSNDYVNNSLVFNDNKLEVNTNYGNALTLKNNDSVTFVGLPATTTILVGEKNDTTDKYTLVAKDNNGVADTTLIAKTTVNANATQAMTNAQTNINNEGKLATNTITFTNTLNQVSPTGLVIRFAPYIIMLGAAIVLLTFTRRRRYADEA